MRYLASLLFFLACASRSPNPHLPEKPSERPTNKPPIMCVDVLKSIPGEALAECIARSMVSSDALFALDECRDSFGKPQLCCALQVIIPLMSARPEMDNNSMYRTIVGRGADYVVARCGDLNTISPWIEVGPRT